MPLVRIDLPAGSPAQYRADLGDIVHEAMVETLDVPEHDRFQVLTEHSPGHLNIDSSYLGVDRSADALVIAITLNQGRSTETKRAFYAALADRLQTRVGIRKQDVMICLTEVQKENWSFGNGEAQYA